MFTFIGMYSSCFLFVVVVVVLVCCVAPFLCYFWLTMCLQYHFIVFCVLIIVLSLYFLYHLTLLSLHYVHTFLANCTVNLQVKHYNCIVTHSYAISIHTARTRCSCTKCY